MMKSTEAVIFYVRFETVYITVFNAFNTFS